MKFQSIILAVGLVGLSAIAVSAEPACEFEDASHRIIGGDNPSDFRCIKLLAAAGDEHWQYYLGLILTGVVAGPKNPAEGLAVLKQVALRNGKDSANAMRFIGTLYMQPDSPLLNYELAYQWLYLASQQPPFKGTAFPLPNENLNDVITTKRMKELERNAIHLLQDR